MDYTCDTCRHAFNGCADAFQGAIGCEAWEVVPEETEE